MSNVTRKATSLIAAGLLLSFVFAVQITFQVDMQYQEVSPDGVHIAGSFQGWDPSATECLPVGDDIYAATLELTPGEYHEYKFINGNAWGQDEGVQRILDAVPDVDTTLDPVFFNDYEDLGGDPVLVTFNLNTATQPGWTGENNQIVIRGSFNGWSGNDWLISNIGGDYWTFTSPEPIEPGNHAYKYVHLGVAGDEWESTSDRPLVVTGNDGDMVLDMDYFNATEPPFEVTDDIDIFFRVSTEGIPGYAGETMYIAGSFTDWGTNPVELTDQFGDQTFWVTTIHFTEATSVEYKYWHGWEGWETVGNRMYDVVEDATVPFNYFDDQEPVEIPAVTKTVVFQVDMTEWLDEAGSTGLPFFSLERNDNMQVRGEFNGWNDNPPEESVMVRQPGTNIFTLPINITNYPDNTLEYKYFMFQSEESQLYLEEIYGPFYNQDMGWEDSPQFGGSNRTFTLGEDSDGDLETFDVLQLPLAGYYDLPTGGVIPPGQSIDISLTVDMNGVEGFETGFEVYAILKDKWMNYAQGYGYGNGDGSRWLAVDNGDGTYTATVTMNGPAPWHQIYAWEFVDLEGANTQEGGGYGFGRFRARYVCPEDGLWVDYDFPMDVWSLDPPLEVEDYGTALECLGICFADGDVNGSGSMDVLDIVQIVGFILGTVDLEEDVWCHADMDGDGSVNILDIVIIVDMILNQGSRKADGTEATIMESDGAVSVTADGFVGGVHMILNHGDSFSIELTENAYMADSHTANGQTHIVVLHPEGALFTATGDFTYETVEVVSSSAFMNVDIAGSYALMSAYPNPFNPTTTIDFYIPSEGNVKVSVYDMLGKEVAQLSNEYRSQGQYQLQWNAGSLASGLYFVKLNHSEGSLTQKVTLLK